MTETSPSTPLAQDMRGHIALIGAGPSGLAAARNLQKLGVPFQGFEAPVSYTHLTLPTTPYV